MKNHLFIKILVPFVLILLMAFHIFWNTIPTRVSRTLSNAFKTTVYIGDATFGFTSLGLKKIAISSLKNSKLSQAFSCDSLKVNAWLTNYLKKDIVIDLIQIDNVYLGLEFDTPSGTSGNWTRLMNNLQQSTQGHTNSSNRTVLIKKLVINNINCQVIYANKKDGPITLKPIDQLVFENITSTDGFPIEQLSNSVLGQMLKEVFIKQNLQDMLNQLLDPQGQIQKQIQKNLGNFGWFN